MLHQSPNRAQGLNNTLQGNLRKTLRSVALLASLCFSQAILAGDALRFSDGSYRVPPPGAPVTAGFGSLHNHSSEPVRITHASSPEFDKVELHLSIVENDVAKMRKLDGLVVEGHSMVKLEHGGYHLMLMGLKQELQADQKVSVLLHTSVGKVQIELAPGKGMGHHNGGHSKNSHDKKHDDQKHKDKMHDDGTKSDSHDGHTSDHGSGHGDENSSDKASN